MNTNSYPLIRFLQLLLVTWLVALPVRAAITVQDYWRLGENEPGAGSGGSCTNLIDAVGGRTLTNTPALSVYPVYSTDVSLRAVTNTGSQLALRLSGGQSAKGNVISGLTDNFGIELWAKPANTAGVKIIAYNGNTSASGWGIYQSGGFYAGILGGVTTFGSVPVTNNVWTHLALVRASGTTTLYVNGVSASTVASAPNPPAGNFLLGANNFNGETFVGSLDEVRVFSFASGQFQVTNLLYFQTPAFTLSSNSFARSAAGGSDSLALTVNPANVSWTATANVAWLHVTNSGGTGNAIVGFTYDANVGGARSGTLTIAGQTVTVSQGAPSYSLAGNYSGYWGSVTTEIPSAAGSNSVSLTVTPTPGTWSVTSTVGWLQPTITSGAGSTNITFNFEANTNSAGSSRHGFLNVNNAAGTFLRLVVFQQAPPTGTGQVTYHFTGRLIPFLPQYIPADASAALKSVQENDVFHLTMTLVPSSANLYFGTWACAVNDIKFTVPSRGLTYTRAFNDLRVLRDANNPNELRWDMDGVDSTVSLILWARDFSKTALMSGNIPNPLNLSGFHADGFAQIILFNKVGQNPTLFTGNLVPFCDLKFQRQQNTNTLSWVTSDTYYVPLLQTTYALGSNAVWSTITNAPVLQGLTNIVTLPATNNGGQLFRLKIL
ncbi:MAG: hypothetical protein H7Y43_00450 [Akkermansiaceae bacterium]|nr:hypothetical protein [Verrucomicrobiales bacterium]